ncbi:MAG TPA: DUF4236 domain-containing protein [Microvirga sp.]|nr:DUF4236 domain-containing protein [Microvirga sp.]
MPFYIRKSISAGPFRFNLSKSGVGLSVGIKGLRVGVGPRGHYIHAGRGGLYYRASLGPAGQRPRSTQQALDLQNVDRTQVEPQQSVRAHPDVEMIEVDSGDVLAMRDENFAELLDEINQKKSQVSYTGVFTLLALGLGLIALFAFGSTGAYAFALLLPAWGLGGWLDSYKRTSVLFYDLDNEATAAYEAVTGAFDNLMACAGKWHVSSGGAVRDLTTWKRNAGAGHIVNKSPTTLSYAAPSFIKTNITPPSVRVGRQTIYFFPDALFVVDGQRVGAVGYTELNLSWQDTHFIEEGRVPADAQVVYHTWKHPNKGGGPDRRFANNYQIPVCLYEVLHLTSPSGLNELLEFSRTGFSEAFQRAITELAWRTGQTGVKRIASTGR